MGAVRARAVGCGVYLPSRVVSNDELAAKLNTTHDWIFARTGIEQRHIADDTERTSDLGTAAARNALADAGLTPDTVDLIVVATTTPDDTFPSTATQVQSKLGMTRGCAFDVQAVCAGFVFALAVADSFIKTGRASTVLVIGAETYSRILDWDDRGTCVLFGDGAGALVLVAENSVDVTAGNGDAAAGSGILSTHLHTDGRHRDILYVDGGPSATRTVGHLRMTGKEVFRHAVANLAAVAEEAVAANGLTINDIDWIVPHQANVRILDAVARKLALPSEKMISTVAEHANTSAASIPLALDAALRQQKIKSGDLVLMEAIGGGLAWGAALARW